MLQKLLGAAVIAVLFAGTASAQFGEANGNTGLGNGLTGNTIPDGRRRLTPEEAQREREIEAQYDRTINDRIPDRKSANDPWGNVRSAPAAASASKQPQR
jgi:hypothetical protein